MSTTQTIYAQLFEQESNAVLSLVSTIDPANYMKPLKEGKAHPVWLLGHIINTHNFLINMSCCGGKSLIPREWQPKFSPDFAGGVAPTQDADFYPSWNELVETFGVVSKACVEGIKGLSDEAIVAELGDGFPEALKDFFKTVDNTLRTVTLHSAYHRGQMSVINLQG